MGQMRRGFLSLPGAIVLLLSLAEMGLEVSADAMVTGTVFCDQCKDGKRSFFDYPLYGARVAIDCVGANGAVATHKEGSTSWMGSYALRFEGRPDLRRCYARVIGGPSTCGVAAGPAEGLKLVFDMFGMQMYGVDSLLLQPLKPVAFCPHTTPTPRFIPPPHSLMPPPPAGSGNSRPPMVPLLGASACSYDKWIMPEHKCYWKVVGPDTKVAVAFGPVAAGKYGTRMTLFEGLHGKGDTYRTLLREATTALLNSFNTLQFPYATASVVNHMNWALLGSSRQALMTAVRFKKANAGSSGHATCNFSRCS